MSDRRSSETARSATPCGPATTSERLVLAGCLLAGVVVRSVRLGWGLPGFLFNDSRLYFIEPAVRAASEGHWVLDRFIQPPLYPYFLSAVTAAWAWLTGTQVEAGNLEPTGVVAQIILLQRQATVAVATATIAAVYLLAKRLLGTKTALWAAAIFALTPLHVVESHRINADAPMLLIAVLSAHQAVIAMQTRSRRNLLASFALAALAGTAKYSGLYAGTLPIWVALRWPDSDRRQRFRLLVEGGLAAAAIGLLALAPAALNWERFATNLSDLAYLSLFLGSRGNNLVGDSWVFAPFLYLLFVGLPFLLNWPVFATAAAGIVLFALRQRTIITVLAAALLPYFILQGTAAAATTRYYLPFAPYLVICAAGAVEALRRWRPALGAAAGVILIAYSAAFVGSQLQRIGGVTQAEAGAALQRLTAVKTATSTDPRPWLRKLRIVYPSWVLAGYDAIHPYVWTPQSKVRFLPVAWQEQIESTDGRDEIEAWLTKLAIDVVIVTSHWEDLRERNSLGTLEVTLLDGLHDGSLGYTLYADASRSFLTQSWYDWADPTLRTLFTAGIANYKIFARAPLAATAGQPATLDE